MPASPGRSCRARRECRDPAGGPARLRPNDALPAEKVGLAAVHVHGATLALRRAGEGGGEARSQQAGGGGGAKRAGGACQAGAPPRTLPRPAAATALVACAPPTSSALAAHHLGGHSAHPPHPPCWRHRCGPSALQSPRPPCRRARCAWRGLCGAGAEGRIRAPHGPPGRCFGTNTQGCACLRQCSASQVQSSDKACSTAGTAHRSPVGGDDRVVVRQRRLQPHNHRLLAVIPAARG